MATRKEGGILKLDAGHLAWIEELKVSLEKENLKYRNDLELVRLAIVCDNQPVSHGVKRVRNMRNVEEKYALDELDPHEAFASLSQKMPGFFHGFTGFTKDGRKILFLAKRNFFPKQIIKDHELRRCFFKVMTMHLNCTVTSIEEMEKGVCIIGNVRGLSLSNFNHQFEKELSVLHQHGYGVRIKKVCIVNSNFVVRKLVNIIKLLLNKKIQERLVLLNSEKELLTFVDSECLPDGIGTFKEDQIAAIFKDQVERFHSFEKCFKIEQVL